METRVIVHEILYEQTQRLLKQSPDEVKVESFDFNVKRQEPC